MKVIKRSELKEKIKKACQEGEEWESYDRWGRYYKIMIDTEDADIWCDVFLQNSWKVYKSKSISSLLLYGFCIEQILVNCLKEAIEKLEQSGWKVEG